MRRLVSGRLCSIPGTTSTYFVSSYILRSLRYETFLYYMWLTLFIINVVRHFDDDTLWNNNWYLRRYTISAWTGHSYNNNSSMDAAVRQSRFLLSLIMVSLKRVFTQTGCYPSAGASFGGGVLGPVAPPNRKKKEKKKEETRETKRNPEKKERRELYNVKLRT